MVNGVMLSIPSSYFLADLVFLVPITPVHAGIGRGGIIDLPIQRDEYGYPNIYSSSLKGALKTALLNAFIENLGDYDKARKAVVALLGPEPEEGESFESSIAILDANLLTMPVRSLRGVYVYVTSPPLLRRFCDVLELVEKYQGKNQQHQETKGQSFSSDLRKDIEQVEKQLVKDHTVCVGDDKECESIQLKELGNKVLLVEEVLLEVKNTKDTLSGKEQNSLKQLKQKLGLEKPLLILHEDTVNEVIDRSLIRLTRVKLERETKTVGGGPWTEEYIPPRTVLYTTVLYKKPPLSRSFIMKCVKESEKAEIKEEDYYLACLRELNIIEDEDKDEIKNNSNPLEMSRKITQKTREKFKKLITENLKGYLIIGGHETIGKGIIKVHFLENLLSITPVKGDQS